MSTHDFAVEEPSVSTDQTELWNYGEQASDRDSMSSQPNVERSPNPYHPADCDVCDNTGTIGESPCFVVDLEPSTEGQQ